MLDAQFSVKLVIALASPATAEPTPKIARPAPNAPRVATVSAVAASSTDPKYL